MKVIRKDWPKVRQVRKAGNFYYVVDLRKKHHTGPKFKWFNKRELALTHAGQVGDKVKKDGLNAINVFTTEPKLQVWTEQCAIFNRTIDDAITAAVDVWTKQREVAESAFVGELLTVWMDDKLSNTLKPLRQRTVQSLRQMANTFKADFGQTRIKEFTDDKVRDYLQGKPVSNQTRKNLRNYLGQFFNWCIAKKYHHENPVEHIEITVEQVVPKFFTVDQCQTIMSQAKSNEMISYFSLCLFAGIRPKEVERMTWENVNLETKEISLPAAITKTKKERLFTISDNLVEWLRTCDATKPLINPNYKRQKDKAVADIEFNWIQDGLRHTFATFHYAKHKSLELLRHDMGNSPDIIERCYKGAIKAADVERFWAIKPD